MKEINLEERIEKLEKKVAELEKKTQPKEISEVSTKIIDCLKEASLNSLL
ncbi:hypothetical protein [Marinisporobacter balticus]|uniref:Uncharacterized protein n=1 Tax=Marinisporobacter balticus TaxID=2018667 RepID=A0A4R2KS90_9FIRM|nr:hypothetical protein [Marinisporobacter balticus]TCO69525.1 hypothetical protein EV214_13149 [Marinisporobacter balticus]